MENSNTLYWGTITIIAALGSRYVVQEVLDHCGDIFSNSYVVKVIVLFAMIELALKDYKQSLKATVALSLLYMCTKHFYLGHKDDHEAPPS